MASSINASTSGGGGVIVSSDATGILNLQSGGSTVVAVSSTGVAVTGTLAATGAVSGTTGTFTSTLGVTGTITGSSTVAGSTGILYPLTSGTAVASTSGTSIDFTGIPSWVKRITVMFSGVSTSGTSNFLIQLGAGSIETTGYISSSTAFTGTSGGTNSSTAGLLLHCDTATYLVSGIMTIVLAASNSWVQSGNGKLYTTASWVCGGNKTLGGNLDRVRLTTVNGTDTFDAGSVNILYE